MPKHNYQGLWKESPTAAKEHESAAKLARLIAGTKGIAESHQKELLSILVWKVTEASGKYNTRFVSKGVYNGGGPIEHEHVITRKELVALMLKKPREVEKTLDKALGCLVTKEEHRQLTRYGEGKGWARYRSQKIRVYDRLKKIWL